MPANTMNWTVDRVAALPGWTSGVALTDSGRLVVSAPQAMQPAVMPTVSEIVAGHAVALGAEIADQLVSVQGLRAGPGETVWALDTGAVGGLDTADPARAALWQIDLANMSVHRRYGLQEAMGSTSYPNDRAVDTNTGTAYIIDAGGEPANAMIVLDLHTGTARRVLAGHDTMKAARASSPEAMSAAGQPLTTQPSTGEAVPVEVGASGITVSPDGDTVFWNRNDELFSIPAHLLRTRAGEPSTEDRGAIDAAITRWPVRPFISDGLDPDNEGNVVFTDLTHSGAQRLDPRTGGYQQIAAHPAISWPDGVAAAPDGAIYLTSSQFHLGPMFHDHDDRHAPFGIFRLTPPKPSQDRNKES